MEKQGRDIQLGSAQRRILGWLNNNGPWDNTMPAIYTSVCQTMTTAHSLETRRLVSKHLTGESTESGDPVARFTITPLGRERYERSIAPPGKPSQKPVERVPVMKCPVCGNADRGFTAKIEVSVTILCRGTLLVMNPVLIGDDTPCVCTQCGSEATVAEFKGNPRPVTIHVPSTMIHGHANGNGVAAHHDLVPQTDGAQ
ncbi:MAG: hypothetical protein LLG06_01820 [Desulfobacteraceae bacterium]|nr:hypothetical protein [Desulfobacteraceae bacterium]